MTKQSNKNKFVATAVTATMVATAIVPVASVAAATPTFPDVDPNVVGQSSADAVEVLAKAGIIKGDTAGNFNPGASISRAEASQMVAKLFDLATGEVENATEFKDVKDNAWYTGAINSLVKKGVLKGNPDGTFGPNASITRAELSMVLVKAYGLEDTKVDDVVLPYNDIVKGAWYEDSIKILFSAGLIKGKTDGTFGPNEEMRRIDFARLAVAADYAFGDKLPKPEEAVDAKINSVKAINKTTVEVELNKEVDAVKSENFTIEGGSVTAANLAEDKKTVTLTVSGLDYEKKYEVAVNGVEVDGKAVDFGKAEFTTPSVGALWDLQIVPTTTTLMADGADNTVVKFKLVNKETGKVDLDADNIVLDLNTTYGTLASKRVTVQDGEASVLLTSEFSNTNISAKIDAQVIEASGDYKELIGKVVGTTSVAFVTSITENVETVTLVNAEANQADRVSLFFDKNVSIKHFVKTNLAGDLLYNIKGENGWNSAELTANQIPRGTKPENIRHVLKLSDSVKIKQANKTDFAIQGIKPVAGNSKAIEVILEKGTHEGNGVYSNVLTDNAHVDVEVNTVNSLGKTTKSTADFKVTDARNPEATSVRVEGLNVLKVKFSEAIADATFQIDGRFTSPEAFTYEFGHFNPVTLEDNRDLATITLKGGTGGTGNGAGYDEDGIVDTDAKNKTLAGYFTAGSHTVQVSSTKDFAWKTDKNNIGQTQNLNFTVTADEALPKAVIVAESPEQFRFTFDKTIGLSAEDFKNLLGRNNNGSNTGIQLQVLNTTTGEYEAVKLGSGNKEFNYANDFVVTRVSGSEYVVELTRDWTEIYNTKANNENYYNDKYRFVVAKGAVTNVANGLKNEVINLDLNYAGSVMNAPDVTSPTINKIERVTAVSNHFHVTMSEPVKLLVGTIQDNAGPTLAQGQTNIAPTTAQFIGKDKDGKTVTIDAQVNGYADVDAGDKVLDISWAGEVTPQQIVDNGGSENWTLVVRAITDDVGNTAASATKDFTITKSPATETPFFVDYDAQGYKVVGADNGLNADTVSITFSEGVQVSGLSDATNPAQYTLNGKTLPAGTSIRVENDDTATHATTKGLEKVVITLPHGTLNVKETESNVITINKNLVSYDGSVIQGATEITFKITDGVVNPTQPEQQALANEITAAKAAVNTVPEANKAALEEAIKAAEQVAAKPNATKEELVAAKEVLAKAVEEAKKEEAGETVKLGDLPYAFTIEQLTNVTLIKIDLETLPEKYKNKTLSINGVAFVENEYSVKPELYLEIKEVLTEDQVKALVVEVK